MRIAILVEGKTETAFKPHLIAFLQTRLVGNLKGEDLMVAINACPEMKAFANTILSLCDKTKVIE